MSHDRKSPSCKPSHRRRSARATRLPKRLTAILRESEAAQRKLDDARSAAVARAAEAETHVAARDMARTELQELQQKIHETEQRLTQFQVAAQVAEQAPDTAKAQLAALQLDADAVTRNLDKSRAQAASPPKSASPVTRPSSSGPRARRGVRRHD